MHRLIPQFILEKLSQQEIRGNFEAASLFVDISGFSTMANTLMANGQHGSEVLAVVMGAIFDPLVQAVYEQGGFIVSFAGDAFTALFPVEEDEQDAAWKGVAAAWRIQQAMKELTNTVTPYGEFTLTVKEGLSLGEVSWGIVQADDNRRASYYFRGPGIDGCVRAEHMAGPGDIILDPILCATVKDGISFEAIDQHQRLIDISIPLPPAQAIERPPVDLELASRFIPPEILTQTIGGEFRQVVCLFIDLPTVRTEAQLAIFMQSVFNLQARYGGFLKGIDFGDKGSNLLLLWGVPQSYENDVERALNFILDLQIQTSIPINAGVTYFTANAGFLGSALREDYVCFGRGVSLAVRFMVSAPRGEVWLNEPAARRAEAHFEVDLEDEMEFKGFSEPEKVYVLIERKEGIDTFYENEMVGREVEMETLAEFIKPLGRGQFAGTMVIWGEAGIGKSRLVHEFQLSLDSASDMLWALCQTDEILRQSFNPFRYWLRDYFAFSETQAEARNKRNFSRRLDRLIAATEDQRLTTELDRTRSFLGAMLDLHWPDSLYEQLDAQGRYDNTIIGLITLLQAECQQQPVILHLEDAHWLDADSRGFIPRFIRALTVDASKSYPIAILATARRAGYGSVLGEEIEFESIDLRNLARRELAGLAETHLKGSVADPLLGLLEKRSEGNPFFAEQILLDLQERGLLINSEQGWSINKLGRSQLPGDIRAVLVARLDRLTREVKDVVQTASVLGREFELRLLMQMLEGESEVFEKVTEAERAAIWSALSEIRYIFKHALLRDAAYRMQLWVRRQALHELAVKSLEALYADDLANHYGQLAYHAEQAGMTEKARHYLRLAGEQAAAQAAHYEAVDYFSRALVLTPESDKEKRYMILMAREAIYQLQGDRESQRADIETLTTLIEEFGDGRIQAEVLLRRSKMAEAISEFEQALDAAQQAIEIASTLDDLGLIAQGYLQWGSAIEKNGEFEAAYKPLHEALSLARQAKRRDLEAMTLSKLGWVSCFQGEYDKGQAYAEEGLTIAKDIGDRLSESQLLRTLAGSAGWQGRFEEATNYSLQRLNVVREIGSREFEGSALMNLGLDSSEQFKYDRARIYYEESLTILREIRSRSGEGMTVFNLGLLCSRFGQYSEGQHFTEQTLKIADDIDSRFYRGLAGWGLGFAAFGCQDYPEARGHYQASLDVYREIDVAEHLAYTLLEMGATLIELKDYEQADELLQEALTVRQEIGYQAKVMEANAWLARLHLEHGDTAQALILVEPVIAYLDAGGTLDSISWPRWVYLNCFRVLRANTHPRAHSLLQAGYESIQRTAKSVTDEAVQLAFLDNVPWNREIITLWESAQYQSAPTLR